MRQYYLQLSKFTVLYQDAQNNYPGITNNYITNPVTKINGILLEHTFYGIPSKSDLKQFYKEHPNFPPMSLNEFTKRHHSVVIILNNYTLFTKWQRFILFFENIFN